MSIFESENDKNINEFIDYHIYRILYLEDITQTETRPNSFRRFISAICLETNLLKQPPKSPQQFN